MPQSSVLRLTDWRLFENSAAVPRKKTMPHPAWTRYAISVRSENAALPKYASKPTTARPPTRMSRRLRGVGGSGTSGGPVSAAGSGVVAVPGAGAIMVNT